MLVWIAALAMLIPGFARPVRADAFTAKVFTLDADHPRLLYTLISAESHEGGHTRIQAMFRLPDGSIAATESAELDGAASGKLIRYTEDQQEALEHGTIESRGGRVYFSYARGGKAKTDDEKLKSPLIVPPTTVPFIHAHWDEIMKGDTVDSRFGVVERCETVGFKFFKSGEQKRDGHDVVVVTMKPSSFIIAAIRSPMTFVFDKATRKVVEFRGQILPKRGGKDQDAKIVYDAN